MFHYLVSTSLQIGQSKLTPADVSVAVAADEVEEERDCLLGREGVLDIVRVEVGDWQRFKASGAGRVVVYVQTSETQSQLHKNAKKV